MRHIVGIVGHKHVAQPHGYILLVQVLCCFERCFVRNARYTSVCSIVKFFYIEQNQIGILQQLLHIIVQNAAIGIDTSIKTFCFKHFKKWNKCFGLHQWLATRNCYATTFAKKWALTARQCHQLVVTIITRRALWINCIGIGAIQTFEIAGLQKKHHTYARPIEST